MTGNYEVAFARGASAVAEKELTSEQKEIRDRYREILNSVCLTDWRLVHIGENFQNGASVYGYFEYTGEKKRASGRSVGRVKVRLSEHQGRWSGMDLDLREPRDAKAIIACLKSRTPR